MRPHGANPSGAFLVLMGLAACRSACTSLRRSKGSLHSTQLQAGLRCIRLSVALGALHADFEWCRSLRQGIHASVAAGYLCLSDLIVPHLRRPLNILRLRQHDTSILPHFMLVPASYPMISERTCCWAAFSSASKVAICAR